MKVTTLGRAAGVTAVLTAIVNVAIVLVARAYVDLPTGVAAMEFGPLVGASIVPAIGAALVYGVLQRYTDTPERNFLVLSTAVLAVSFLGFSNFEPGTSGTPGALPASPELILNTLMVLSVLHVATAAVIVAGIVGLTGRR